MKNTIKILFFLLIPSFSLANEGISENWQLSFQQPATDLMSDIISFHSYILMPIITGISLLVLGLLLYIMFRFNSSRNHVASTTTHNTTIEILWTVIPVILLIVSVIGSIYSGVATAPEAASLGVVGALILSFFQKSLTVDSFKKSLLGATKTSCMIGFILAGSTFLSLAMGVTGLPRNLAIWIDTMQLSPYILIIVLMIFYIILCMTSSWFLHNFCILFYMIVKSF